MRKSLRVGILRSGGKEEEDSSGGDYKFKGTERDMQ